MTATGRSNVGYAFINFNYAVDAERFRQEFSLHRFQGYNTRKVGSVSAAHVQGLDENLRHFESRKDDQFRPIVFNGSLRIEFKEALAAAKTRLHGLSSQPRSCEADEGKIVDEPKRGSFKAARMDANTLTSLRAIEDNQSDSQESGLEPERLTYYVTIDRTSAMSLGLTAQVINGCVSVSSIIPGGLVDAWNIMNPSKFVNIDDQIIEVNDVRGNSDELLESLKYDGVLSIQLFRKALTSDEASGAGCGQRNSLDDYCCGSHSSKSDAAIELLNDFESRKLLSSR
jgi:hypothetical protein